MSFSNLFQEFGATLNDGETFKRCKQLVEELDSAGLDTKDTKDAYFTHESGRSSTKALILKFKPVAPKNKYVTIELRVDRNTYFGETTMYVYETTEPMTDDPWFNKSRHVNDRIHYALYEDLIRELNQLLIREKETKPASDTELVPV